MARTICSQCGEVYSDGRLDCPHCGHYRSVMPSKGDLVIGVVSALISIGLFALAKFWLGFALFAIIAAIISVIAIVWYRDAVERYNLSQRNPAAYQKLMIEKQKKLDENALQERQRESERFAKLPACPICGSKACVKRLSSTNRAVSVAAWGAASAKIGKQYECTRCKHFF